MTDKRTRSWPWVKGRTSGLVIPLEKNVTLVKEKRPATDSPRCKQKKKERVKTRKLKRVFAKRDQWKDEKKQRDSGSR